MHTVSIPGTTKGPLTSAPPCGYSSADVLWSPSLSVSLKSEHTAPFLLPDTRHFSRNKDSLPREQASLPSEPGACGIFLDTFA